jgi:Peptidase inhibitor family I36
MMKRTVPAVAFAAAAALVLPVSASADSGCQNGKLCAWSQPGFTGDKEVEGPINLECIGVTLTQGARSTKNMSTRTIVFFTGQDCAFDGSPTAIVLPNSQNSSFEASFSFLVTAG